VSSNVEDSRTKDDHLSVCLEREVESRRTTGLEAVLLEPGVPDFALSDMDLSCSFLGKSLSLPLVVSPITGGGSRSRAINLALAEAAETCRIAMAVGSVHAMLEKRVAKESYLVREAAPSIPLISNLGLVHVKRGRDYLLEAVESIDADGISIYINPLHEILQKDGEVDFRGCLEILGAIAADFPYPVLIKEVGFGLGRDAMDWASRHRIAGIDVAGTGGTNWSRVEGYVRNKDYRVFEELGTCTRDALVTGRRILREDQYLVASGGIRTGIDMAKCFALGAHLASMALPFLKWAACSPEAVTNGVARLKEELTVGLWYGGCRTPSDAKGKYLPFSSEVI